MPATPTPRLAADPSDRERRQTGMPARRAKRESARREAGTPGQVWTLAFTPPGANGERNAP